MCLCAVRCVWVCSLLFLLSFDILFLHRSLLVLLTFLTLLAAVHWPLSQFYLPIAYSIGYNLYTPICRMYIYI